MGWGEALENSGVGIKIGIIKVAALFFADDVVLIAENANDLRKLIKISEEETRKLKLTLSIKKSMVMSPSHDIWDLCNEKGEVYASLDKILTYKYLGLETYNTMPQITTAKQSKCLKAARRYRAACRYLSRQGPDVVDMAICCWRNVAMPAICYGVETIMFSENTLKSLEQESAKWAKETLNLPSSTANVCPQVLLGVQSFKHIIYNIQLKYFARLQNLPQSRYAAQALLEHEQGGWKSPYMEYITKLRSEVGMVMMPRKIKEVELYTRNHFVNDLNLKISTLSSIQVIKPSLDLCRARAAREGEDWRWVCMGIMGSTGMRMAQEGQWNRFCLRDGVYNTDLHCVSSCSLNRRMRFTTGLTQFFASARVRDISDKEAYKLFLNGLSLDQEWVDSAVYQDRAKSLQAVFGAAAGATVCCINGI